MECYRCENPDCGFTLEEEPDVCPHCGGTFFLRIDEEEMTASDWVSLGGQAVDEAGHGRPGVLPASISHGGCSGPDQPGLVF